MIGFLKFPTTMKAFLHWTCHIQYQRGQPCQKEPLGIRFTDYWCSSLRWKAVRSQETLSLGESHLSLCVDLPFRKWEQ